MGLGIVFSDWQTEGDFPLPAMLKSTASKGKGEEAMKEDLTFEPGKRTDHHDEGDEFQMIKDEDLRWLNRRLDTGVWDILSSEVAINLLGDDRPEMTTELEAAEVVCHEDYVKWRAGRKDFLYPMISETTLDAIRRALKAEQDRRIAPFRQAFEEAHSEYKEMLKRFAIGTIPEWDDKIIAKDEEVRRALDKAKREITWMGWDAHLR